MNTSLIGGLAAILLVIVIAMFMRSARKSDTPDPSLPRTPEPEPSHMDTYESEGDQPIFGDGDDEEFDDEEPNAGHVVAVTSDGHALIPDGRVVRMLPPEDTGEEWKVGAGIKSATLRAEKAFGMTYSAGDLRGARVVRGGAEEGAWVLETLGRDGEFLPFDFETIEAAEAAMRLFESQGVVQFGEDEDGNPAPPSSEQFEEARRIYRETLSELGMDEGEEPR